MARFTISMPPWRARPGTRPLPGGRLATPGHWTRTSTTGAPAVRKAVATTSAAARTERHPSSACVLEIRIWTIQAYDLLVGAKSVTG
jgi:hypothetical protein